jgi:hypothetical protein
MDKSSNDAELPLVTSIQTQPGQRVFIELDGVRDLRYETSNFSLSIWEINLSLRQENNRGLSQNELSALSYILC